MWVISVVNSIRLRLREQTHRHTDTCPTVVFLTWPVMLLRMVRVTVVETCKQSLNLPADYPNCERRKSSKSEWWANPLLSGGWSVQVRGRVSTRRVPAGNTIQSTSIRQSEYEWATYPLYRSNNMAAATSRVRLHAWVNDLISAGGQAWRWRLSQDWLPLETEHLL